MKRLSIFLLILAGGCGVTQWQRNQDAMVDGIDSLNAVSADDLRSDKLLNAENIVKAQTK